MRDRDRATLFGNHNGYRIAFFRNTEGGTVSKAQFPIGEEGGRQRHYARRCDKPPVANNNGAIVQNHVVIKER